ncbi:MAG: hypothetical protein ACRERD_25205 [Candidatus Binatia bacterium]
MATDTAKRTPAKKTAGRKPMTDAEKREARRLSEFDYSAVSVEESEDLSAVRARENNEMISHLQRSLDQGTGEGLERVGKTFAMTLPDKGVASRAKSKLVSAAEHLKIGVRTTGPTKVGDGPQHKVSFRAVGKRKKYAARKSAQTAQSVKS